VGGRSYVSYNLVLAISVLGPLGVQAKNKNAIRNGAILGGIGLGVSATAIYFAMERNFEIVRDMEIPMIYLAGSLSYILQIVYALVLIGEIYTTAVGSLYGFSARITDINEGKAKFYIIGATLLALAASQLGFSNMVKYLYPVVVMEELYFLHALPSQDLSLQRELRGRKTKSTYLYC